VKFTGEEGLITLDVKLLSEEDDICKLQFCITDTGIGIKPEQIKHLFDSFKQADSNTTRKYGGTGLGLTISKNIVELMNGKIFVESEPGIGSKFFFTIKLKQAKKQKPAEISETNTENIEGLFSQKQILLVEDIKINSVIVQKLLEPTEIKIDLAENGVEALEAFFENGEKYDLILMDLQMPLMDGYEATRRIRAEETAKAKNIPIIAMTANVFKEDIAKCLEAGMNDHIGKPLNLDLFLEKLRLYLL
jgi:CheY-like chemotaxis protein